MSSVPFKIRVYTCIPCLHISTHNHYVLYHAISPTLTYNKLDHLGIVPTAQVVIRKPQGGC